MIVEELAAAYLLRSIPSDDLKDHAYQLMLAGYEDPILRRSRGPSGTCPPRTSGTCSSAPLANFVCLSPIV